MAEHVAANMAAKKKQRDEKDMNLIAQRYKAAHDQKLEKLEQKLSGVVSPGIRWSIFAINVIFWIVGFLMMLLGIWAFLQKTQKQKSRLVRTAMDVITDITIVFAVFGFITFTVAFAGCVGTLRQNIRLLKFFRYILMVILSLQLIGIVSVIVFTSVSVKYIQEFIKKTAIVQYTEDIDLQNIIDFIQLALKCCGVGDDSYRDWNRNRYFNCTPENPSTESCSLPFSCCISPNDISADIINTKCAYKIMELSTAQIETLIWPHGCISKLNAIVKRQAVYASIALCAYVLCLCLIIDLVERLIAQIRHLQTEWNRRLERHDSKEAVSISDLVKRSYKRKLADRKSSAGRQRNMSFPQEANINAAALRKAASH